MKKLIFGLLLFALQGCAGMSPYMSVDTQNLIKSKTGDISQLREKQTALVKAGNTPVGVANMSVKARVVNDEIAKICTNTALITHPLDQSYCRSYYDLNNNDIASMDLASAQYYASSGDKVAAKSSFRSIILSYPGKRFEQLRKAAEFGLEDLKEAP